NGKIDPLPFGEPPLAGWTVYLDMNDNDVPEPGIDDIQSTDDQGQFVFADLPAGFYRVRVVLPDHWSVTSQPALVPSSQIGGSPGNPVLIGVRLPLGSISGSVFQDVNGNGIRDDVNPQVLEPGLAGVLVYVDLNDLGYRNWNEPFTFTDAS